MTYAIYCRGWCYCVSLMCENESSLKVLFIQMFNRLPQSSIECKYREIG